MQQLTHCRILLAFGALFKWNACWIQQVQTTIHACPGTGAFKQRGRPFRIADCANIYRVIER